MAGLDPAIQGRTKGLAALLWMAASKGGHDVEWAAQIRVAR